MKELKRVLQLVSSMEFWRMAVLWTLSLLISYWQLIWKPNSYQRCPPTTGPIKPVCIITGATSGLGSAAAYSLSKQGFYVVLAGRSSDLLSKDDDPVPSRIVNVTSFTHRNVFGMQVDKETVTGKLFLRSKNYQCAHIYEYSKFCLLLFSYGLHRKLGLTDGSRHVSVLAADPGVVRTNIMREVPSSLRCVAYIVLRLMGLLQSPEDGITSVIDAALAPPETSGVYFFGGKGRTVCSSTSSRSTKLAEQLWSISCDIYMNAQLTSHGDRSVISS